MILSQTNFDIWYNEYRTQFEKSRRYAKSRGGIVRDISPLTRAEFKADFISFHEDRPKLSGKQIAQRMAKDDVYVVSSDQAQVIAEAHVKHFGGTVNLALIQSYRIGKNQQMYELIREFNERLKQEGLSSTQRKEKITMTFFAGTGNSK